MKPEQTSTPAVEQEPAAESMPLDSPAHTPITATREARIPDEGASTEQATLSDPQVFELRVHSLGLEYIRALESLLTLIAESQRQRLLDFIIDNKIV